MMRRRLASSLFAAAVALLLGVQPVLGVTFTSTVTLTSDGSVSAPGALAVTGTSSAVAVFEAHHVNVTGGDEAVYVRRTTDGGKTWTSPQMVSDTDERIQEWASFYESPYYVAGRPAIAASGQHVNLVFSEQYDLTPTYGVRQLYSYDGGRTWFDQGSPVPNEIERPVSPAVARSGSTVVVSWTDGDTGAIWIRVSTNNGDTFRDPIMIGSTTARPWQNRWDPIGLGTYSLDGEPAIAFGTSVLYVAWNAGNRIVTRRSTDGAKTWKTAVTLSSTASSDGPTVAAYSTTSVVGYVTDSGYASIRRSTDSGRTWKGRQSLSSSTRDSSNPLIVRQGTTWLVLFERCLTSACTSSAVYERKSTNVGATWTTESRVSPSFAGMVSPAGVGLVGTHVLVLYARHNSGSSAVYTRRSG